MSIESNEILNPNKKIKYIDDDDDNDSLASALSDYNGVFYGNKNYKLMSLNLKLNSNSNNIDAPTMTLECMQVQEKLEKEKLNKMEKVNSIDSLLDDNKTDDDADALSTEDDFNSQNNFSSNSSSNPKLNSPKNNSVDDEEGSEDDEREPKKFVEAKEDLVSDSGSYIPVDDQNINDNSNFKNDLDIDKEFEDYLNDEDDDNNDNYYLNNYVNNLSSNNQREIENHKLKYIKLKKLQNLEYTYENYELFRQMAIERYGFINKKYRRKAWPLLILYKNKSNVNNNFVNKLESDIANSTSKFKAISKSVSYNFNRNMRRLMTNFKFI